jgi:hypothetical protein
LRRSSAGRRGKGWKEGVCEGTSMDVLFAPLFVGPWMGEKQLVVAMTRLKLLMIKREFELPPNFMILLGIVLISGDGFNDVTIT